MVRSLVRQDPAAEIMVLALDDDTAGVLRGMNELPFRVIELRSLLAADPELARVQATRSRMEFIFALTPCFGRHLFETYREIERLVYLDADLFFFADPEPIWAELGSHGALIVAHQYPGWHDDAALYGSYNVGVVGFGRNPAGLACLGWWREQCLASTSLTADGVHYGDQKYLDEWPARFVDVVVATHPGVNLAPWNWAAHHCAVVEGRTKVDGRPLIVFHFAQFKWIGGAWFDSGQLEYGIMPRRLRPVLYGEYWAALGAAQTEIQRVWPSFTLSPRGWAASLGPWHLALLRLFWGQFWFRFDSQWFACRLGLGQLSGRAMGFYRRWQRRAP